MTPGSRAPRPTDASLARDKNENGSMDRLTGADCCNWIGSNHRAAQRLQHQRCFSGGAGLGTARVPPVRLAYVNIREHDLPPGSNEKEDTFQVHTPA